MICCEGNSSDLSLLQKWVCIRLLLDLHTCMKAEMIPVFIKRLQCLCFFIWHVSVCLLMSVCLFVWMSIHPFVYQSVCISVSSFFSVFLSACVTVCSMSIYVSLPEGIRTQSENVSPELFVNWLREGSCYVHGTGSENVLIRSVH